ncbi:MAG: hypothetical protein ACLP9L_10275 [Thermoguttaceae bacterium]
MKATGLAEGQYQDRPVEGARSSQSIRFAPSTDRRPPREQAIDDGEVLRGESPASGAECLFNL